MEVGLQGSAAGVLGELPRLELPACSVVASECSRDSHSRVRGICGAYSSSSPEQHVNFSISAGILQPTPELNPEEDAHALDNFCNRAIAVASGLGVPRCWKLDSPVVGGSRGHSGDPIDHRTQSSCVAGENIF